MQSQPTPWTPLLMTTGQRCLTELAPLVDRADPLGTISPRSRLLCAALSQLGLEVHASLGGSEDDEDEVARAGALLALLTKIDDQVIDGKSFHGGEDTDRDALAARTRSHLAPTLKSIRSGRAETSEARCELAAVLGHSLAALAAGADRLDPLLQLIERGWAIQVDAVTVLTAHPSQVSLAQVARTSADISGAWLMMIATVGTLPSTARRGLTRDEQQAFFDYGRHIQLADALADLYKDLDEGLISTYPSRLAWERSQGAYERAVRSADTAGVYDLYASTGADLDSLPSALALDELDGRLAGLGRLADLLRWIHGFLTWRYLVHPLSQRSAGDEGFAALVGHESSWVEYLEHDSAPDDAGQRGESTPCSEP